MLAGGVEAGSLMRGCMLERSRQVRLRGFVLPSFTESLGSPWIKGAHVCGGISVVHPIFQAALARARKAWRPCARSDGSPLDLSSVAMSGVSRRRTRHGRVVVLQH